MLFPTYDQWVRERWADPFFDVMSGEDLRRRYEAARKARMPYTAEWGDELPLAADEWLIEGILPKDSYALVYGPRGAGKSFVALDMAYSAAAKLPFLSNEVPEAFGSVYLVGEKKSRFSKRPLAWLKGHGRSGQRLPVLVCYGVPNLLDNKSVEDTTAYINEEARPLIEALGVPLRAVFIDTLMRSLPGHSVSDQSVASRGTEAIGRMIDGAQVSVVVMAHVAKSKSGARVDATAKGAGEWEDAADTVIRLERQGSGNVRTMTVTKQSDGPDGATSTFELEPVDLARDRRGKIIRSCVVREVIAPARSCSEKALHPDAPMVLARIGQLLGEGKGIPTPACEPSATGLAVSVKSLREQLISTGYRAELRPDPADGKATRTWFDSTRKTIDRALASLAASHQVRRAGDLVWPL